MAFVKTGTPVKGNIIEHKGEELVKKEWDDPDEDEREDDEDDEETPTCPIRSKR